MVAEVGQGVCEEGAYLHSIRVVEAGGYLGVVHDQTHSIFQDTLLSLGKRDGGKVAGK